MSEAVRATKNDRVRMSAKVDSPWGLAHSSLLPLPVRPTLEPETRDTRRQARTQTTGTNDSPKTSPTYTFLSTLCYFFHQRSKLVQHNPTTLTRHLRV